FIMNPSIEQVEGKKKATVGVKDQEIHNPHGLRIVNFKIENEIRDDNTNYDYYFHSQIFIFIVRRTDGYYESMHIILAAPILYSGTRMRSTVHRESCLHFYNFYAEK
ncbi:hypothetical protein ACJX0J_009821, partial [Zea mays]